MKKFGLTLLATGIASTIFAAAAFAQSVSPTTMTASPTPTGSVNGTSTTVPNGAPATGRGE